MDLQSIIANAKDMFGGKSSISSALNISGDGNDPNDPQIKINDPKGLKSGDYSKKHIQGLISAAKVVGIDPKQLLALSLQESGIGTAPPKKLASGRQGYRNKGTANFLGQVSDFEPAQEAEMQKLSASKGIDPSYLKPAIVLRDKLKYAKHLGFNDEAMALQAYNGYGVIPAQKDANGNVVPTKYYGQNVPAEGLNMRQNPLYGKRLLELKSDLSKNKYINSLIDENTDLPVPTATSVIAKR